MQRYFVEEVENESTVEIFGEDAHHISRVMRMKTGDEILCCFPTGKTAKCVIENITNEKIKLNVVKWIDETNELPVHVTIAQGLPKGDKLELVVQKGTELGAKSFLPFFASRSIVKWDEKKGRKKVERLQKIAKEAAEQAHRNTIPNILDPVPFQRLLDLSSKYDTLLVAYEEDAKQGEKSNLLMTLSRLKYGSSILVVFGPEGGLSPTEIEQLTKHGFITCSLGPRILRTETAPLYFLSAVSYQTELLE